MIQPSLETLFPDGFSLWPFGLSFSRTFLPLCKTSIRSSRISPNMRCPSGSILSDLCNSFGRVHLAQCRHTKFTIASAASHGRRLSMSRGIFSSVLPLRLVLRPDLPRVLHSDSSTVETHQKKQTSKQTWLNLSTGLRLDPLTTLSF